MNQLNTNLITYLEGFVTEKRKNTFKNILLNRTRHFTVVLEDIFQQHNSSAVIRSCDVFGIQDIHIIENKYHSKVSRHVAKGSQKWLNLNNYKEDKNNTKDCLTRLKNEGYQIIATSPHNNTCTLHDLDISKKSAFIFGVEKSGVSEEVLINSDEILTIPMVGFTESLNISVSAAIILQYVTSKLSKSNIEWQLTADEIIEKRFDWVRKTIKNYDAIVAHYKLNL